MTRIALVSPSAKAGGAERALVSIARHLPAHGFAPAAILLEPGPLETWLADADCEVVLGPAWRVDEGAAAVEFVSAQLVRLEADAVVSNKWMGHLIGGRAAAASSIPAIWWQHDIARPSHNPPELRAAAVPAAAIVCVSEYAARAQEQLTPGARIVSVYGGIPIAKIAARRGSGTAVRTALGWTGPPLVGMVARLERWKEQDLFLRAARRVAAMRADVRFAVVGGAILGTEGSYPKELRRLARKLGLAERVHFSDHQVDVYPWFDALDVVVHTARAEPFGLVVAEAMALGKPVVALQSGGPAEIVEPERSGLLVPPDERVLAAAVLRLLEDGELATRLGAEARRRVARFSEERMAARFASVLRSVLVERRPPVLR